MLVIISNAVCVYAHGALQFSARFCYTVRQIGVTQTNAFNNIRPVFTALWMLIFFAENLPLIKWIGVILIIFGLFVSQKQEKSVKY